MRELSLNILDIAQNSIKAGAKLIEIDIDITNDYFSVTIKDDGCGMDEETLKRAISPFMTSRTERKVGMGIPLFKYSAEITGGSFDISSKKGEGTTVNAVYITKSLNRMPMGDLAGTLLLLIAANEDKDFVIKVKSQNAQGIADTRALKAALGGVSLQEEQVLAFLKKYLQENITDLYGGLI